MDAYLAQAQKAPAAAVIPAAGHAPVAVRSDGFRLPCANNNVIHIFMRFVWQVWNLEHCARHGVSRERAEAVVLAPDFTAELLPGSIRAVGFATVAGRRYRAVIQFAEPDEVYVITCHPAERGGRRQTRKGAP